MYQNSSLFTRPIAAPPTPAPTFLPNGLKGRVVSSYEEVKAAPIDFDGSITYFPDISNHKIYTKQFNMDGTCTTCMYSQEDLPQDTNSNNYITRTEFEEVINRLEKLLTPEQKQAIAKEFKF